MAARPQCDVCGRKGAKPWTLRPGDARPRRRYICDICGIPLQAAYDAARPVRGAAAIESRIVSR